MILAGRRILGVLPPLARLNLKELLYLHLFINQNNGSLEEEWQTPEKVEMVLTLERCGLILGVANVIADGRCSPGGPLTRSSCVVNVC